VPQHLELDDVIAFGLGALDLVCVAAGACVGWWLALVLTGDPVARVVIATPFVTAGLVFGVARPGERSCRTWLALALGYVLRARVLVTGADE